MKKILSLLLVFIVFPILAHSQVLTADPALPTANSQVVLTFDASLGSKGLMGYLGDVYAHIGVITNLSTSGSDWKYVKSGSWGVNTPATLLTRISTDKYQLTLSPSIKQYFGITSTEVIQKLAIVFRSSDGSKTGKTDTGGDIFYTVYQEGLNVKINSPSSATPFQLLNSVIDIAISSSGATSTSLYHDNQLVTVNTGSAFTYQIAASTFGKHWIKAEATNGATKVKDSVYYFVKGPIVTEALPANVKPGVNITGTNQVTFVLFDPPAKKQFAYLIGSFNNWELGEQYAMKRTPDGKYYWLTITNLDPNTEYLYQYQVDGQLLLADPYCEKVSDPWNDKYITNITYPNLIKYPDLKTAGIASSFIIDQTAYTWKNTTFTAPQKNKLVIYELLIRDFVSTRDIKTVIDTLNYLQKLGVNAIQLMPVTEFEGNDSWGYNPAFYFAPDKAYGTKNDYKRFVDECHSRGIAVILDMVLNHSFGSSPMVQMYFAGGKPSADNPWFNIDATHDYNVGYDFNHSSIYTQEFSKRVMKFWIDEYKVDGYRFDLSKGFTQTISIGNVGKWGNYDADRIALWKTYYDYMIAQKQNFYVILEHFADNSEETVLANYGMMLWGNQNYNYGNAVMGKTNSNFNGVSYKSKSWNFPNLVGYMESHDEERLMYNCITNGNASNVLHNVKDKPLALLRVQEAASFFLTVPGPKMIWQFGEIGYDYSINYNSRVGAKPLVWNYLADKYRKTTYDVFAALNGLKKDHPVFSTTDFTMNTGGNLKSITLNNASMNVHIIGNFDVNSGILTPEFQHTGTWYDFFTSQEFAVNNVTDQIELQPGEYHIYTDVKLSKPVMTSIPVSNLKSENVFNIYPNPANDYIIFNFGNANEKLSKLNIFNVMGQTIKTINISNSAEILWDLKSDNGSKVNSGLYFYQVSGQNKKIEGKIIIK